MFTFGSGNLYAVPATANATPVQFGTLQDVQVNFSFSNKELRGQYQFPVAIARADGKIDCKAKSATISALAYNTIFFGNTNNTGGLTSVQEAGTVPAVSTYIITVSHSGTWVDDLGVTYAATGLAFTKVASGPTVGQYSVAAGVYTFAAADANAAVIINYSYTITTGFSSVITNNLMGAAPTFAMVLTNAVYLGKNLTLKLYSCVSKKLGMNSKNQDWTIPEFDFDAFANAANNIGQISLAE